MKTTEIKLQKQGYLFNTNARKGHYTFFMRMGQRMPFNKSQARYFVNSGVCLDVLNYDDVLNIEALMNKHGYEGEYKYTKSQIWVRLQNNADLISAIAKEFGIKA